MPATVTSGSEITLDSGPAISTPEAAKFNSGEKCYAVVRPEKLQVETEGERTNTDQPGVEGLVESSLYLGTATQMAVNVTENVKMTVLCPNVSEEERQSLPGAGAKVRLTWAPDQMHLVAESDSGASSDLTPTENVTKE